MYVAMFAAAAVRVHRLHMPRVCAAVVNAAGTAPPAPAADAPGFFGRLFKGKDAAPVVPASTPLYVIMFKFNKVLCEI